MSGRDIVRQVEIIIAADLDPDAAALDFARRAREDLEAEISAGRAPPRYRQYVDGREGVAFDRVSPGGSIVAEFVILPEVAAFALAFLQARSPASGGRRGADGRAFKHPYRESFWASVNGRFFMPEDFRPEYITADAELIIGNLQPYNRKVDVQIAHGRKLTFSVPAGIFEAAAKAVNATFGNMVSARRLYSYDFPGRYRLLQTQVRKGTGGRVRRWAGTLVESPVLVINPR